MENNSCYSGNFPHGIRVPNCEDNVVHQNCCFEKDGRVILCLVRTSSASERSMHFAMRKQQRRV